MQFLLEQKTNNGNFRTIIYDNFSNVFETYLQAIKMEPAKIFYLSTK